MVNKVKNPQIAVEAHCVTTIRHEKEIDFCCIAGLEYQQRQEGTWFCLQVCECQTKGREDPKGRLLHQMHLVLSGDGVSSSQERVDTMGVVCERVVEWRRILGHDAAQERLEENLLQEACCQMEGGGGDCRSAASTCHQFIWACVCDIPGEGD